MFESEPRHRWVWAPCKHPYSLPGILLVCPFIPCHWNEVLFGLSGFDLAWSGYVATPSWACNCFVTCKVSRESWVYRFVFSVPQLKLKSYWSSASQPASFAGFQLSLALSLWSSWGYPAPTIEPGTSVLQILPISAPKKHFSLRTSFLICL